MYLTAIMDWHSRRCYLEIIQQPRDLLCVEALEKLLLKLTACLLFLIRIRAQYTSQEFTNALKIQYKISMDGKGRWVDNVAD